MADRKDVFNDVKTGNQLTENLQKKSCFIALFFFTFPGFVLAQSARMEISDGRVSTDGLFEFTVHIEYPSYCQTNYTHCSIYYDIIDRDLPGFGVIASGSTAYSAPFVTSNHTVTSNGKYDYYAYVRIDVKYCNPYSGCPTYPNDYESLYTDDVSVEVIKSNTPVNNEGFTNDYEIRRGDINSDGRVDLYVRAAPGGAAPVGDFILQQTSSKDFTLLTSLTSSQRSQAQQWPTANILLTTGDFNVDSAVDLLLEDVANVISGAFDQIVFSPRASGQRPKVVTALDEERQQFFAEVGNALHDPDYFENYAPVTTTTQTFNDYVYGLEMCSSVPNPQPHGAMEFWPPVTFDNSFSSVEDFYASNSNMLQNCIACGFDYYHYDWMTVPFSLQVGSKDYRVFSGAAIQISKILRVIIESQSMPEGSPEKEAVRRILEQVFGFPVFGPQMNDDEERYKLLGSIGYLSRLSEGKAAIELDNCPGWDSDNSSESYAHLLATHLADFEPNQTLINRGRVSVTDNGQSAAITIDVYFGGTGDKGIVKRGAVRWNVCRTLPSGKEVTLNIVPKDALLNEDVTVSTISEDLLPQGKTCTDNAEQGGNLINQCSGLKKSISEMVDTAEHEFGHILGFPNVYDEQTETAFLGFERDVMAITTGVNEIYSYHLEILLSEYN